jgi:demethylmenaquinone methyltransferase/2-methoxy-6-polyprenyl-1,4-benzoquinol methylase
MVVSTGSTTEVMEQIMQQNDVFNKLAEKWDEKLPDLDKVALEIQLLGIKYGDSILDVGCGTGVLLPFLRQYTDEDAITAIDAAEQMIAVAKRKYPATKARFLAGDALTYALPDEAFNHVICFSMFPHFSNQMEAIRILGGKLKLGGLFSVIHAASKEVINGIHIHANQFPELQGDYLFPIERYIPALHAAGLREEIQIDNDAMYLLSARKTG